MAQRIPALAVAGGTSPLPYPPGTIIQLIPNEAMVKRGGSFDLDNADWEYFFLDPSEPQTRIIRRGRETVFNFTQSGNCFNCHTGARTFDFICEQDHGCVALNLTAALIDALQNGDPRCSQ